MVKVIAQKSVLISGCSAGGIGDALAKAFHSRGCRVFATARNLSKVQHLKDSGIEVLHMDVLDVDSCTKAAETVRRCTGGTLDILVNNSGLGYAMPLLDADIAEVKRVFETNVVGIIITTKAFASLSIEAKGTIVNIGSVTGIVPLPWSSIYNSSKAAVNQLTDTFRQEMQPLGVKVILAISGTVKTKFLQNLSTTVLPESSFYAKSRSIINMILSGKTMKETSMDVVVYAEDLVANVLKARPTVRYWSGTRSSVVWIVNTFLWVTIWDFLLGRTMKMAEVTNLLQEPS